MKTEFDYEKKVWGSSDVRLSPVYLGALRLRYCLDSLKNVQGKVLEVGCGGGGMSRAVKFYRPDLQVFGVDISNAAIREAKKHSGGVAFVVGDAYKIPFANSSFDGVFLFDVLEHVDRPQKLLHEVHRVLKKGGRFYAFIPTEGQPFTLHGILNHFGWRAKELYGGHIQQFTNKDVEKLYKENGFRILKTHWYGHVINQLFDTLYFSLLQMRKKSAPLSVEGYIQKEHRSVKGHAVALVKNALAAVSYGESTFLSRVVGSGLSVSAKKV